MLVDGEGVNVWSMNRWTGCLGVFGLQQACE